MKKDRLFLDLVAVVSLMISSLFFVGFFVKDKSIGQTAVNFAPFADCTVKVSTLMSFSPLFGMLFAISMYGLFLMKKTYVQLN